MFESTRKKKKDKKHLIGSAVVADHAAVEMTEKANVEYHKPKYSSQNRKKFYDNHSALNNAKDKAFKNGENAKDNSVGAIVLLTREHIPKTAPRIAPAPGPNRIAPRITGI